MTQGMKVTLAKECGSKKHGGKTFKISSIANGKADLQRAGKVLIMGMNVKYLRVL